MAMNASSWLHSSFCLRMRSEYNIMSRIYRLYTVWSFGFVYIFFNACSLSACIDCCIQTYYILFSFYISLNSLGFVACINRNMFNYYYYYYSYYYIILVCCLFYSHKLMNLLKKKNDLIHVPHMT